jgi:NADH-quinone oxidoreductase subunit L
MTPLWLMAAFPAAGAAVIGLFGVRWFSRKASAVVACSAIAASLVASLFAFAKLVSAPAGQRMFELVLADWIPELPLATARDIGFFKVGWTLRLDPLAVVMLLVVTGVGLCIHVYATAYMRDERRGEYARFFAYMNLFCAFMLLLVLAGNFVVLFVGWEGVGLCSYLLIGFWYRKPSAADAGKKAFIVNRIGDLGFLLGLFLVFFTFGTLDFREVSAAVATMAPETMAFGMLSAICLLLFVGAVGKSAQIPLFVWLPDAMEGPTPVSALIHAATMVTAGVYIIARNAVLFEHAPLVLHIIAIVGAATALVAAAIAVVQTDIKRVLAYSTISQLGYMFLAIGVGAFAAAVFHLVTHALFKALLFLGSGSVIHALRGEQDMRHMGALKRQLPVTLMTMSVGALALAGIPPLSGFFSKDAIQLSVLGANPILFAAAVGTLLLTAFYITRLLCLTFLGTSRAPDPAALESAEAVAAAAAHGVDNPQDAHAHGHAERERHEVTHGPELTVVGSGSGVEDATPRAMWVPLVVLAAGVVIAGALGIPTVLGGREILGHFLAPGFAPESASSAAVVASVPHAGRLVQLAVMVVSVLIALVAIFAARFLYLVRPEVPGRLAGRWPGLHAALSNQLYVDELYRATIVRATLTASRQLRAIDRRVVDTAVDGVGTVTQIAAWLSHMSDKYLVDGTVTAMGRGAGRLSFLVRSLQTGLVQNYALLMLCGLFAFLTLYLLGGW